MATDADTQTTAPPSLKRRAIARMATTLACLGLILFLPAWSLRFWQGWLFLALMTGFWTFFLSSLWQSDRRVLQRRLQRKEPERQQALFQKLSVLITIPGIILAGLDYHLGWTRAWFGPVPNAIVLVAQAVVVAGYWLVFWVMKTNTFAATVIKVEQGQRVIDTGPYALVRHPMYLGMSITMLAAPVALGSYLTLPRFALYVNLLAYRLIHEERTLRRNLTGYAEFCQRTRFRLIPRIW